MVKAGKQTLALAARYSPLAASNPRRHELRRPVSYQADVCKRNDQTEATPALRTIRAEFCKNYKSRIEENAEQRNEESNAESQELRNLYRKLRDVVPALSQPRKSPVTSLDVVLSAIDYIRDLHTMLGEKFPSPPAEHTVVPRSDEISTRFSGRVPFTQLDHNSVNFHPDISNDNARQVEEDSPTH